MKRNTEVGSLQGNMLLPYGQNLLQIPNVKRNYTGEAAKIKSKLELYGRKDTF